MKKILFADDDPEIREVVRILLTREGYEAVEAVNGIEAVEKADHTIDLIILDVMMPGCSGVEACGEIRKKSSAPILFLTAKSKDRDKEEGFAAGGDDYLVKPFEFPELLARVRSLLRRGEQVSAPDVLKVDDLELDPARHRAYRNGQRIDLTTKEFALLHLLMRRSGEVLSRTQIISLVWDMNFDCDTNVVEVSIRRLRAKIDDPFENKLIHTLRGVGYVLEARQ